jgi:hypothetical protein
MRFHEAFPIAGKSTVNRMLFLITVGRGR